MGRVNSKVVLAGVLQFPRLSIHFGGEEMNPRNRVLAPFLAFLALAAAASAQQTVNFPNFCNTSAFTLNGITASLLSAFSG